MKYILSTEINEQRSKKLKGRTVSEETRTKMKASILAYVARTKGVA